MCAPLETPPDAGFHAAYKLTRKLCALAARPPIIRDMVPNVVQSKLIYSTWRSIQGRSSPSGLPARNIQSCLTTHAKRFHSTAVLLCLEQHQHLPVTARIIAAYESYSAMMEADQIFDFNRVWFIGRSAEAGKIALVRCDRCATRFAEISDSVPGTHCCPACALSSNRGTSRARAPSEDDPAADASPASPSTACPAEDDSDFLSAYTLMEKLCVLGARPPIVRDMVPDIVKRPLIYATWRTLQGRQPPQGQLPQSLQQMVSSPSLRLHTTAVLSLLKQFRDLSLHPRTIRAFEAYRQTMGDEMAFDFNRIWFLARAENSGRLRLTLCRDCGTRFAHNREDASDANRCPACSLMGGRTWAKKKTRAAIPRTGRDRAPDRPRSECEQPTESRMLD